MAQYDRLTPKQRSSIDTVVEDVEASVSTLKNLLSIFKDNEKDQVIVKNINQALIDFKEAVADANSYLKNF